MTLSLQVLLAYGVPLKKKSSTFFDLNNWQTEKSISNRNQDYLSSIEMLIIDQMDALTMQNWDHVKVCLLPYYYPFRTLRRSQFVMSHMNGFPKESRDTDISRIKPWYLDGQCVETHLVRN